MNQLNVIDTLIEITFDDPENFSKIRETLTRIGIPSGSGQEGKRRLFQSCHILHKRERYYIVHFKEMFALDGKPSNMSEEDYGRRNLIASLIQQWGLANVVDQSQIEVTAPIQSIKILPHREKDDWLLVPKYNIGNR